MDPVTRLMRLRSTSLNGAAAGKAVRRRYFRLPMKQRSLEAAEWLRPTTFVLDGEGVILRHDGLSKFDRLHSLGHEGEVQLFLGFDLPELDGTDLRKDPLLHRKGTLASLLRQPPPVPAFPMYRSRRGLAKTSGARPTHRRAASLTSSLSASPIGAPNRPSLTARARRID
jgi:hypothetical protein